MTGVMVSQATGIVWCSFPRAQVEEVTVQTANETQLKDMKQCQMPYHLDHLAVLTRSNKSIQV